MKARLIILLIALAFYSCKNSEQKPQSLFNGTDLSGWHVDVPAMDENPDTLNPFIVRDGMLVTWERRVAI